MSFKTFEADVGPVGVRNSNWTSFEAGVFDWPGGRLSLVIEWNHAGRAVGCGEIIERDGRFILDGCVTLATSAGRAFWWRLLQLGHQYRWSLSAVPIEWKTLAPIKIITRARIIECSPTRRPASNGTHTVSLDGKPIVAPDRVRKS